MINMAAVRYLDDITDKFNIHRICTVTVAPLQQCLWHCQDFTLITRSCHVGEPRVFLGVYRSSWEVSVTQIFNQPYVHIIAVTINYFCTYLISHIYLYITNLQPEFYGDRVVTSFHFKDLCQSSKTYLKAPVHCTTCFD